VLSNNRLKPAPRRRPLGNPKLNLERRKNPSKLRRQNRLNLMEKTPKEAAMKELLEYMVKALVDNPGNVQIEEIAGEKTIIYELKVGEGDLGKVIGKEGRMAKAIRTILTAASMKKGKRAQLEIIE
jgi:predicted RNA-binding protein YlqC (UPF0109 family)